MPIRFRCVYCDKLLGIAKRKAGAVVNCPQCHQPLIVPSPEPEPTAAGARPSAPVPAAGKLFEQDDFDVYLEPHASIRAAEPPPPGRPRPAEAALPPQPFPIERSLPAAPLPLPVAGGVVLSTGVLIVMVVLVLLLIGAAFGGGFLVGRMMNQG
jgi:phage FluMu protein Com